MRRLIQQCLILLTFATWAAMCNDSARAVDYFYEDFESVTLGDSLDEHEQPDPVVPVYTGVWTDVPPAGWTADNSKVPGFDQGDDLDGVTEWAGWGFADNDWWSTVAGDQRRKEFSRGHGVVAIADPDEWDDDPHRPITNIDNTYSVYMATPTFSIADFLEGELFLQFDSSFRPECCDDGPAYNDQSPVITASFDGAAPVEILRWSSDPTSPRFKDENSTNEHIALAINAPAGTQTLQLDFGLERAENDWWWAVDNVQVTNTVPEPSSGVLLAGVVASAWFCHRLRRNQRTRI
ncbi:MAG: hypothetical protein SGJ19_14345 [Planctomycetia bacterium]|nr:hypothetical protein [Planctomycetia bacterium]